MNKPIHGTVFHRRTGWILLQGIISPPRGFRSGWARAKTSTAIWADVVQDAFDALPAESAFEAANHRIS